MHTGYFLEAGGMEGWAADLAHSTAEGVGRFGRSGQDASKYVAFRREQHVKKHGRNWVEIRLPGQRICPFQTPDHDQCIERSSDTQNPISNV